MRQISLLDILKNKEAESIVPEAWECMNTCENFNCKYANGDIDYFPSTNEPRCINAEFKSKLINNIWITKCKNYIWREL